MKTNYHTHTTRCMHATGSDEDYVLSAIKGGYQELGFSDHTPWKYHTDYVADMRMLPEELPGYVESLRSLREKYRDQISIKIGLECEYFPAYIHPEAKIGENVEIAPFVFIDKNVVIGDNNKIMANANILYGSRIGNGNTIFPGAVIGAIPQDLKFRGEETTAEIGNNNTIRENVTINRGTAAKGKTIVGSNNLLMEGVHVAHDAFIGNGCIIGNSTKMAGEIVIDDNSIISANVLMHQFCHVGGFGMIQGGCRFSKDIPPYIIAGREPICYAGINIVGLRRRGFSNETIEAIHNAYRIIYQSGLNNTEALKKIENEMEMTPEISYIVNFIRESARGIIPASK